MANFFSDNKDIQWQFEHMDLSEIISLREGDFSEVEKYPYAPRSVEDAVGGYQRVLELVGQIAAETVAPRATDVDRDGCTLKDGRVCYAKGTQESLKVMADADLMGFTLPRQYGGLNIPTAVYSIAIELISRADASFMTLFGLQDIAETILEFGSDDQRERYLPRFASGAVTGAMVLTEPDAGSDLQAVRLKATEDPETGQWKLNGVKRFITNGCGEVLLVLARSEPGTKDGRGLSLYVCERGPTVVVRRIEDKLGIHGSPTCELHFQDTPAELVGKRRRGLTTYVMFLMNGARVGIGAQALGVAEAAYRDALAFAAAREQFGKRIMDMPPVAEMLLNMKCSIEAGRSLLYETARVVDMEQGLGKKLKAMSRDDPAFKETKARHSTYRKLANVLTPMVKYYLCEMAERVCSDSIQVHGGSGYMRDYDVERYFRDSRITSIYEGTSQLQIVAIRAGLAGKNLHSSLEEFAQEDYGTLAPLAERAGVTRNRLDEGMEFLVDKNEAYGELVARRMANIAVDAYVSYLLLREAGADEARLPMADRWIAAADRRSRAELDAVKSGDDTVITKARELLAPDIAEE